MSERTALILLPGLLCDARHWWSAGGRQDVLTPPELSEEIGTLIPGAELTLIDDCGHLSTMERPTAVTAAIRSWLTAPVASCSRR